MIYENDQAAAVRIIEYYFKNAKIKLLAKSKALNNILNINIYNIKIKPKRSMYVK